MKIAVLAYEGVRLMDVTAPLEVFTTAARLGASYEVVLCSLGGGPVATASGTRLETEGLVSDAHTFVVPGGVDLPRQGMPEGLVEAVREVRARRIASVCTGAFVLAAAGVLDGRRATTHWRHTGLLARLYPGVTVEADSIYVRDRGVLTSAGVSAGIDLALAMVEEDCGGALAREVARDLVVFLQRPGGQSQFSVAARTPRPRHDPLRGVLDAIAADPAADHSLPVMAARAGVSVRHLTRLFHEQVGETPGAYVEALRVEAAQAALDAGESVTGAAARAGFGSDESLRRAFLRRLGVTPSAYRSRFRTAFS